MKRLLAAAMAFALLVAYTASCSSNEEGEEEEETVVTEEVMPGVASSIDGMTIAASTASFAIKPDGSLWVWGWCAPMLDTGAVLNRNGLPTPVCVMDGVVAVSTNSGRALILQADGSLWMINWGLNVRISASANSEPIVDWYPEKVLEGAAAASAGSGHCMAILRDGSLWGWGNNNFGQVGDGTTSNWRLPIFVMDGVASVSAGRDYTMAIKDDGSLWAWGWNEHGQLGIGTSVQNRKANPDPIKVMDDVAFVAAGWSNTLAIRQDGSLWAWGSNVDGQLGDGTVTDRCEPVWIMDDVVYVAAGGSHTLAIRTDGSLWAWGRNHYGQLGDGTITDSRSPVRVMENVAAVAAGGVHTMVIKTDGSLWAWGGNELGQLGDGTFIDSHTPVKIMDEVMMPGDGIRTQGP